MVNSRRVKLIPASISQCGGWVQGRIGFVSKLAVATPEKDKFNNFLFLFKFFFLLTI